MNTKLSEKRLKELKASKTLDQEIAELQKVINPKREPPRKRVTHFIQIKQGEEPEKAEADYRREHDVSKRDVLFILNMGGLSSPGSKANKPVVHKETDDDYTDDDDPIISDVLEDMGASSPSILQEVGEENMKSTKDSERPPRLRDRSWAEIRQMQIDGALTEIEERWLAKRNLPGGYVNLKVFM